MRILTRLLALAFLLILVAVWRSRDATIYAPGFSEAKFRLIRVGMPKDEVIRCLGEPLSTQPAPGYIYWSYAQDEHENVQSPAESPASIASEITFIADLEGKIIKVYGGSDEMLGHPLEDVRKQFGNPKVSKEPNRNLYWYSKMTGTKGHYIRFVVVNDTGLVGSISAGRIGHYIEVDGVQPSPSSWIEWLEWNL